VSEETQNEQAPPSGGLKGIVAGLAAALLLGAAGFYAAYSGLIGGEVTKRDDGQEVKAARSSRDITFVPLDPLVVSLGRGAANQYLRFSAQLEVSADDAKEVELLRPRVLDVLNGYLRAVDSRDIENPAALGRLRAQMLRRVQLVTGKGRVRDLLITEFVLN
jgi:flagellar protein FliL